MIVSQLKHWFKVISNYQNHLIVRKPLQIRKSLGFVRRCNVSMNYNPYIILIINILIIELRLIGESFDKFIPDASKAQFERLLKQGKENAVNEEINILTNEHKTTPVRMSINAFPLDDTIVVSIIITDLTIQHKNQEEIKLGAEQLKQKNTELESASKELVFQNSEKEKRAAELVIANRELAFQNSEKEKRAAELSIINKDLTTFTHISSHDLQEPLRKIRNFVSVLLTEDEKNLSETGKKYLQRTWETAKKMQEFIEDLLTYSRVNNTERHFEKTNITTLVNTVKKDFEEEIQAKKAIIEVTNLCESNIIRLQFQQVFHHLISNSLKFWCNGHF